jgi:acetyl-CoA C-acetyltransferase
MPAVKWSHGGQWGIDMGRNVGIIGVGQTRSSAKREDVSFPDLIHEAVQAALDDAGISLKDIDAVVFGSAPEYFEGVNHPEKWCAGASGAFMKPQMRIHTGGTVGASTGIAAYYHAACGMFDTVLAVSGNKLSEGNVTAALTTCVEPIFSREFACGAASVVGFQSVWYMDKYGYTEEQAAKVAVKNRKNALKNPYAQLRREMTVQEVLESPPISYPLKLLDCCPVSDGAAAMVLASADKAKKICSKPAWIKGVSTISEGPEYPDRDWADPIACKKAARTAYQQAGIKDPAREIHVAELYEPFSFSELMWYDAMYLCDEGQGGRMIDDGVTEMTGAMPVNPSGGVLSNNPIGSAAMLRQIEAAMQVMGKAGEHQIEGAKTAVAHGLGGAMQFHTVMVVSSEDG